MNGSFIWLPTDKYPKNQKTFYNALKKASEGNYTVCSINKRYELKGMPKKVILTVSADTSFLLKLNGKELFYGPAYSGGDFLNNDKPRKDYYSFKKEVAVTERYLDFSALVRLMPCHICEYSRGQGGFYLHCVVVFENGETIELSSDESWEIKRLNSYTCPRFFDNSVDNEPTLLAEVKSDIWQAEIAPIPPCTLSNFKSHTFLAKGKKQFSKRIEYERVYAGYLKIKANAPCKVKLKTFEVSVPVAYFEITFSKQDTYYPLELLSIGGFEIEFEKTGDSDALIEVIFDTSHFPVYEHAKTTVSDSELNELLDICAHTLKYCRQSHHLDSPLHCEPLACVGDYYIEMLMTQFSYGDLSLVYFDLERIAKTIEDNGGRLFHTTYSLIWVKMLYECYMLSGNYELLVKCVRALDLLFELFTKYIGKNGIIETPPDYMFVDWLFPDGISTHHPPKALGQTALNMFYFGALNSGAEIYRVLKNNDMASVLTKRASELKEAIFTELYDGKRELFFEGLNTETPSELLGQYMPKNVEKRYYRRHSNILACYFGLVNGKEAASLLEKVYNDNSLGEVQPYFMHFWFEAVYNCGLSQKYTLKLLEGWRKALKTCKKGLPEGFYPPEPSYHFDYSHAWGGTPLYSLPRAITGIEIKEAGYKKISLCPTLLSFDSARVEIPTPHGQIVVEMAKNQEPKIILPKDIELI